MAASKTFLSEDQLQCSICLEIFTKPVSTPCGHNYCMVCLNKYWDNSLKYNCPYCKKKFTMRPTLCVNTLISDLVAKFNESKKAPCGALTTKPGAAQGDVLCDVCTDATQKALKSCLDCGMSFCDTHLEHHKIAEKLKQHKLIDAVKDMEGYICQRHQRPLELYCKDDQRSVCVFCTEGEHKSHTTVPIEEESADLKTKMWEKQTDVQTMINYRLNKIQEIMHSVALKEKNIDREKEQSTEIFRSLMRAIERKQSDLLMVLEETKKDTNMQAKDFVTALDIEVTELERHKTELETLLESEDNVHVLQVYTTLLPPTATKDWDKLQINSRVSVDGVKRDLLHIMKYINSGSKLSGLVSLDYQKLEISKLLKNVLRKGDTWYVVDAHWFRKWKKYVGFDKWNTASVSDQTVFPGPVNNSGLLKDSCTIKERLIEHLDYILLPEEGWSKLISWYGLTDHQKPIARQVIMQGVFVKHYKVEVYLTELILCEFSKMEDGVRRHFSKADTLTCIEKEMRKIFNIPDGKKTRLWCQTTSKSFKQLVRPRRSVEDSGLFQGQLVVIEQSNEDGTCPQGPIAS